MTTSTWHPKKRSRSYPPEDSMTLPGSSTNLTQGIRKSKRTKPQPKPPDLIELTNALPLLIFSDSYLPKSPLAILASAHDLSITLSTYAEMTSSVTGGIHKGKDTATTCLDLIEQTSAPHYRAAGEQGWQRHLKRKEMAHPAIKYLLLFPRDSARGPGLHLDLPMEDLARKSVLGFLSFMITEEDRYEVIYCYELHLVPELRGKGLGRALMQVMEMVGGKVGVEKAMLTVFRVNQGAVKAYERCEYREDEFSPEPRRLKSGKVKESGYVILSKGRADFAVEKGGEGSDDLKDSSDNRKGVAENQDLG